ncbi:MAG: hypothetical protein M3169_03220 [Candidatus Eremiobacteraeota bacterium]|nr:hypothetical protein [Candidatus Eremiobacteraeota bacterium]
MIDDELGAIQAALEILEPLDGSGRARAVSYLSERLLSRSLTTERPAAPRAAGNRKTRKKRPATSPGTPDGRPDSGPDIAKLVNRLKNLANFSAIEIEVLDQSDLLRRILVALAIYRQQNGDGGGMTSGDIVKFYSQLGIKLGMPNVSTALSGRAKRFVITDGVRTRGAIMRYRLSHHGMKEVSQYGIEANSVGKP